MARAQSVANAPTSTATARSWAARGGGLSLEAEPQPRWRVALHDVGRGAVAADVGAARDGSGVGFRCHRSAQHVRGDGDPLDHHHLGRRPCRCAPSRAGRRRACPS
eukprot:scaffold37618_cov37-Phaeocystis_antarctica.AAC.1